MKRRYRQTDRRTPDRYITLTDIDAVSVTSWSAFSQVRFSTTLEYDTILYAIFTRAAKLTRWPA